LIESKRKANEKILENKAFQGLCSKSDNNILLSSLFTFEQATEHAKTPYLTYLNFDITPTHPDTIQPDPRKHQTKPQPNRAEIVK